MHLKYITPPKPNAFSEKDIADEDKRGLNDILRGTQLAWKIEIKFVGAYHLLGANSREFPKRNRISVAVGGACVVSISSAKWV